MQARGPAAGGGQILPWGWWLTQVGSFVEDGKGGRWRSVREAFWNGRLGFPPVHYAPEQHELLLRVLSTIEQGWPCSQEGYHDLFSGDMMFWRFYMCWLASIRLVESGKDGDPLAGRLTNEGLQVRLMLSATAEPAWAELPIAEVVDAVRRAHHGEPEKQREAALQAFERETAARPTGFARKTAGRTYMVVLTGLSTEGRMPLRRTFWSLSFADPDQRDDFYGWLAQRAHRWDDWADIAYRQGANGLTQHLLGLMSARIAPAQGVIPPEPLYLCVHAGEGVAAFEKRALSLGGVKFRAGMWLLDAAGPASRLAKHLTDKTCVHQTISVVDVLSASDLAIPGADVGSLQSYFRAARGW